MGAAIVALFLLGLNLVSPASAATGDQVFKMVALDAAAGDQFGTEVAVSGNVGISGAPRDDDSGSNSGSAYLFDVTTGLQLFKLAASDANSSDEFGAAVAIDGNLAVVGASSNDDPIAGVNAGSAYVFDVSTGAQLLKLLPGDLATGDFFGGSVAISGNVVAVGSFGDDDAGSTSGAVYLFNATTGAQTHKLTATDAAAGAFLGDPVGMDGNVVLAAGAGAVYVFDATTGSQTFKLLPSDGGSFGSSVGVSGNLAVIGRANDNAVGSAAGSAYIFDVTTGAQLFKVTASDAADFDTFGGGVAIDGTTAIIGAGGDDNGAGVNAGAAYLFDATTGVEFAKMTANDGAASDYFAQSVGVSGGTAVAGAYQDDDAGSNSGSAYVMDASVAAPSATLTLKDQYGDPIAGSQFFVNTGTSTVTVSNGGSLLLDPGTYPITFRPGIAGLVDVRSPQRAGSISVTGANTFDFVWETADITITVVDQYGDPIPGSQWIMGGQSPFPTGINGASATLPITEDPSLTITGTWGSGYYFSYLPGIDGILDIRAPSQNTTLEVASGGSSYTFVWELATVTVNIVDQFGATIPASRWLMSGQSILPSGLTGTSTIIPVTEDPALNIGGTWGGGYWFQIAPGINGLVDARAPSRNETIEIPTGGIVLTFEWKTAPFTVNVVDQFGATIAGSVWALTGQSGLGGGSTGDTITLPVTEDPDYSIGGTWGTGYWMDAIPGINGLANNGLARQKTIEIPVGGSTFDFLWKVVYGTVCLVDATETEVSAGVIDIQGVGYFTSGDDIAFPVTEDPSTDPTLANIRGFQGDGYRATLRPTPTTPTSQMQFELAEDGTWSPLFVNLGGADYGIRFKNAVSVAGTVTSDCDGPLAGVAVTLLDGSGATHNATTAVGGAYLFENITRSSNPGQISVTVPDGYTANTPTGGTTSVDLTADQIQDFGLDCIYVTVSGTVSACNGGLQGVTVDLDLDPLNPAAEMDTTYTDASGFYSFSGIRWSTMDAEVSIVVPLGFEAITPVDGHLMVEIQSDQTLDFSLGCLTPDGTARSMGYWKHQAKVYVKNKGHAQETELAMTTTWPAEIFNHFYENSLNSISVEGVTFMDLGSGPEPMDLATIHATMSIKGNAGMVAKAKRQYLALLLNIASGKLLTTSVISDDGGTASQALQQVATYINDGDASNDEIAKDIGDAINNAQLVAAGIIDLGITDIYYRRGFGGPTQLMGALQNPFQGATQIRFRLAEESAVSLVIYDVRGRIVRTLVDGTEMPGEYTLNWDGQDRQGRPVGSGMYYIHLRTTDLRFTRSVVRLR